MGLLDPVEHVIFKPFHYEWAYEAWKIQRHIGAWFAEEVKMGTDVENFRQSLTDDERSLLTYVFRFFVQCFDKETEILTEKGWTLLSTYIQNNYNNTRKIACITDNSTLEFHYPLKTTFEHYKGKMHLYQSNRAHLNMLVTPNHKMVFKYKDEWREQQAENFVPYQGVKILRSVKKTTGINKLTPLDRLAIAYQADGYSYVGDGSRHDGYKIYDFGFKKARKIKRLEKLLNLSNLEYTKRYSNEYTYFKVFYKGDWDKEFSWININNISFKWCKSFLKELSKWDGSKTIEKIGIRYTYSNTNQKAIDVVQAVVAMAGIFHGYSCGNEHERNENHTDCEKITYNFHTKPEVDGQAIRKGSALEDYDDKVYCVTVPTGKVLIRRKMCVSVSGNSDIQVGGAYINTYLPVIHPHEIHMMFVEFAAQESNHQVAYAHLIDSLGLPESDYAVFLNYQEMRDKYDYMNSFKAEDKFSIACTLAAFGAFSEGLQLYASFAMLLNFQRFNMMVGMCQIVAWSVRDEALHVVSIIKLFHILLKENPDINKKELGKKIREICENVVHHEDMFIDAAFGVSSVRGITREAVKTFIRYIADKRMVQLGFERIYLDAKTQNPFPWMDDMLSPPEHANFFEQDATAYSEPITKGDWEDAFDF